MRVAHDVESHVLIALDQSLPSIVLTTLVKWRRQLAAPGPEIDMMACSEELSTQFELRGGIAYLLTWSAWLARFQEQSAEMPMAVRKM
jgi:hypothetical protein